MTILDARGRQIVRLISFGDRTETRERPNEDAWLGASSATGHTISTSSIPWLGEERVYPHVARRKETP